MPLQAGSVKDEEEYDDKDNSNHDNNENTGHLTTEQEKKKRAIIEKAKETRARNREEERRHGEALLSQPGQYILSLSLLHDSAIHFCSSTTSFQGKGKRNCW
jgi:hypothetical protein